MAKLQSNLLSILTAEEWQFDGHTTFLSFEESGIGKVSDIVVPTDVSVLFTCKSRYGGVLSSLCILLLSLTGKL